MQDKPIMSVTVVIDDETGIWANDICEYSYSSWEVEQILNRYGQKGYNEILSMLHCLENNVKKDWKKLKGKKEKSNGT